MNNGYLATLSVHQVSLSNVSNNSPFYKYLNLKIKNETDNLHHSQYFRENILHSWKLLNDLIYLTGVKATNRIVNLLTILEQIKYK